MSHQSVLARLDQKNASCPAPSQSPVQSSSGICIKQEYFEDQFLVNEKTEPQSPPNQHNLLESIKVEVKEEEHYDEQDCRECVVKRELDYDEQSDNEQQMDNEDNPDTNAHNVTVNIKTEPMDCDFVVVKEEIKEEDDEDTSTNTNQVTVKTEWNDEDVKVEIKEEDDHDDDCDGCVRCLVKKEEVSDDDEVDHEEGELIRGGENDEVIQANLENGELPNNPRRDIQNASNSNESIEEGDAILSSDEQLLNPLNEPNDQSVTQSSDLLSPSTSTGHGSNRTALNEQATVSSRHTVNKRRQSQLNRIAKRSKKTEEGDDGEEDDFANDDQVDKKIKVFSLNFPEANCEVRSNSLHQLYGHLNTIHGLLPHRYFAQDCNTRCDNRRQICLHIKSHQSNLTQFVCHVCGKVFASQKETYNHWHHHHQTGQFECNVNGCSEVFASRMKVHRHQHYKHCPESKRFSCAHDGCSSSFVFKKDLARHELTHLNTRPFHCTWPHCNRRTNQRGSLIKHIRTCHFALPRTVKEQKEKKIEDDRDPNEYVRVVEEGDE